MADGLPGLLSSGSLNLKSCSVRRMESEVVHGNHHYPG